VQAELTLPEVARATLPQAEVAGAALPEAKAAGLLLLEVAALQEVAKHNLLKLNAEQTWASHKQAKKAKVEDIGDTAMFSPKKQQVEKDCSLMSFVREAVAKLTQEDRKSLNQMAISYAELMAGIGTGTIAMECIVRALATEEVYMQAKPAFFSESCTWKRHRLLQTLSHLKLSAYDMFGSTSDLKALATDLVIVSIECDDISMSSTTQKSVLDTSGRSGQSLTQFFAYLTSLEQTKRPGVIIFECVAALKYNKQFETGTEK
ncbi:unnamed protein product, partial [Effrenium voratum]